ncbi:membrane protein insertase YidC [Streptococcus pseudopneumoniae]|uniref:membrane protein insertase YidC n=1 Tax=Streptococcus TaxID=1301 RepID=UPI0003D32A20|nr:membrane protein insertase YidC [Streptococcus pseudopneumoniae]ETE05079.1 membrane protein [Streptococcus pseudopneumoniae 22725]MBF9665122.1 membrane protein insertase YidC [Streptococcus pseudopneumoniae]TMR83338.1 membrane protein insertase YidC [Streptococcus pseudopneumoniae]
MKSIKRFALSAMGVAMLLVLTGCVNVDKTTGQPTGVIWNTFGAPMAEAIKYFANDKGLGFGVAIIIVTIIVRLIILPLGIYQSWKATLHSEKMNALKHVLEPHQTRLKEATTQEEKLEAQQALFAAQKEHGISMFGGVGCFPLLLQMPFFSAIYFTAQHTEGVAQASYLGIPLGSPSMILAACAGVLYYLQSLLSLHGVEDQTQRDQIKKMAYVSPVMIAGFSLISPASVTLYWVVGGFMMILQQFIVNYIVRPKLRKKVREELAKNPPKASAFSKPSGRKDVTPEQPTAITSQKKHKNRNAGKQRSR